MVKKTVETTKDEKTGMWTIVTTVIDDDNFTFTMERMDDETYQKTIDEES